MSVKLEKKFISHFQFPQGSWMQNTNKYSHPVAADIKRMVYFADDKLIQILCEPRMKFEVFINDVPQELVLCTLELMRKVCQCTLRSRERTCILQLACNPKFLEHFSSQLIVAAHSKMEFEKLNTLVENIIIFFESVSNLYPYNTLELFYYHVKGCYMCTKLIKNTVNIADQHINKFQTLLDHVQKIKALNDNLDPTSDLFHVRVQSIPPPTNFRSISVYPSAEEILTNMRPQLKPNRVGERYESVEDYLDIQFRLLREDFLRPLREGIFHYRTNGTRLKSRDHSIRIYNNVHFERSTGWEMEEIVDDKNQKTSFVKFIQGTKVKFIASSNSKLNRIDWKTSKRLMHNSLVCFSSNNFKSVLFATVTDRSHKSLSKGYIYIDFCEKYEEDIYNSTYVMLESEVYFEPYYHVLKALQNLNYLSLPMIKYLVNGSQDSCLPQYSAMPEDPKSIMYALQGVDFTFEVTLLSDYTWPTVKQMGLDASQLYALQTGLTEELAVIQGPPGTGKTFIGLKIVEALLNKPQKNYHTGPILIICLTNHALDQFLEGVVSFTNKLIRIGGQSKSNEIKIYNIKHKRRYSRLEMGIIMPLRDQIEKCQNQMAKLGLYIDHIYGSKVDAISSITTLEAYKISSLSSAICTSLQGNLLLEWLGLELPERADRKNPENQLLKFELYIPNLSEEISMFTEQVKNETATESIQNYLQDLIRVRGILLINFSQWAVPDPKEISELLALCQDNVWTLSMDRRWKVYWWWMQQLAVQLESELRELRSHQQFLQQRLENVKRKVEVNIMASSDVVGMTTAGGARLHEELTLLGPEILIVEEAAEVLESHIIACLTKSCKHLILIGDHKQLRPSNSVYQLAREYGLDVSLFERMVRTRGGCVTLEVQHRMAPCIASLITPSIYDYLENHPCVENLPKVKGIPTRLFFINHTHSQDQDSETSSFKNTFESHYVIALCGFLKNQGYQLSQITILTTYSAQLLCINKEIKANHPHLQGVRVTVVDNYQGEENDILLLSLVRSNPEHQIGFLATHNRVCVALSRAKQGFYIIGNMQCLSAASRLWRNIQTSLENQHAIGPALPIQCQHHGNMKSFIKEPNDFSVVSPLGGCTISCTVILACGHPCNRPCHILNHDELECQFPCKRMCPLGHPCSRLCFEKCTCSMSTEQPLPNCQHKNSIPCGLNPADIDCSVLCEFTLRCGHKCQRHCHVDIDPEHVLVKCKEPCSRVCFDCPFNHLCKRKCYEPCKCTAKVKKLRSCGHHIETDCGTDVEQIPCLESDLLTLDCGHVNIRTCSASPLVCTKQVKKKIVECGHFVIVPCNKQPRQELCTELCEKKLQCGHTCKNMCSQTCTDQCQEIVESAYFVPCSHRDAIHCWENSKDVKSALEPCKITCNYNLLCGHTCEGTCGTCKQYRFHIPCLKPCKRVLVCGHNCPSKCSEPCSPCIEACTYRCAHGVCSGRCGEPCAPCQQPCTRVCSHNRCPRKCSDVCSIPPCREPCPLFLKCKHHCMGFCGDPCPPLCKICDAQVTKKSNKTSITSLKEKRFLILPSCGHTLESHVLEMWTRNETNVEVGLHLCPQCLAPMYNVPRYQGRIKKAYHAVQLVTAKMHGDHTTELARESLEEAVTMLISGVQQRTLVPTYKPLIDALNNLQNALQTKNRQSDYLALGDLLLMKIQYCVLSNCDVIWDNCHSYCIKNSSKKYLTSAVKELLDVLEIVKSNFGLQQVRDFYIEINRLQRISQLEMIIENIDVCPEVDAMAQQLKLLVTDTSVRYTKKRDTEIQHMLIDAQKILQSAPPARPIRELLLIPLPNAPDLSKGNWFHCDSSAHVYLSVDKKSSKCFECL